GSVKLASSDPFTFPLMDSNYFATAFDLFTMRETVKAARQFVTASPWRDLVNEWFGAMGAVETYAEIVAAARDSVLTIWHPTSSARMSPKGARHGVVDPDLLVKHVAGLRVVDASVCPAIPACHTTAPVYILAERASALIKAAWYLK
ncbi:hypothetical protein PHLGIDRAFT_77456, partial [Phlebiopsis gigantea 11061_1 CR5-6]